MRAINRILTATYWEVGRRIVEFEQKGHERAGYGEALLERLADDLVRRLGRGYSRPNLQRMRSFYLGWELFPTSLGKIEARAICSTVSSKSFVPSTQVVPSGALPVRALPDLFPLPCTPWPSSQCRLGVGVSTRRLVHHQSLPRR